MSPTAKTEGAPECVTLSLANTEFSYPGAKSPLLKIPEFRIKAGESIFLYGPSGAGKSTLLEIIGGIHLPQKGQMHFQGQDMMAMSGPARDRLRADHMGFIFQSFNLLPFLTARQNIELGLHFSPRKQKKASAGDFVAVVERLNLGAVIDQKASTLSVGQSQRVAAARAFLGQPELLIADEPTSSLDADHREKFIEVLFELAKVAKQSLLFVSHDRSLAKHFNREISLTEINKAGAR